MKLENFDSVKFFIDHLEKISDRTAYFETSAQYILTPPEAMVEAIEAVESVETDPKQTWQAIEYVLGRVKFSFKQSILARELSQLKEYREFTGELSNLLQQLRQCGDWHQKQGLVAGRARNMKSLLVSLDKEVKNTYEDKLFERLFDVIQGTINPLTAQSNILKRVPEIAAYLGYQGRDIGGLIDELKRLLPNDELGEGSGDLVEKISNLLKRETKSFYVATVITGSVAAPIDWGDAKTMVFPNPKGWPRGGKASQKGKRYPDSDLNRFCFEHWGIDHLTSSTGYKVNCQIVVWPVKAWDAKQARQLALDLAEEAMDRINAEHRTGIFGVKRKVLVWERGAIETTHLSDDFVEPINRTRVMRKPKEPHVNRSLRFASRASTERAGALSVFFSWMALEYLGRGVTSESSAQNFVAKNVPKIIALAAIQHLAVEVYHNLLNGEVLNDLPKELSEVLRQKLRKNRKNSGSGNKIDLHKLVVLLQSPSPSDCSEEEWCYVLNELEVDESKARAAKNQFESRIADLNPLSVSRIRIIRSLYQNPNKMKEYLKEVQNSADVSLQRMRFVRNQTAHSDVPESQRFKNLSAASLSILDTCYQALDSYGASSTQTLAALASRFDELIQALGQGNRDCVFSPGSIFYLENQ